MTTPTPPPNPLAQIWHSRDKNGDTYDSIVVWCPGCATWGGGLCTLPVSGDESRHPVWQWNGDLVRVTLTPSIMTGRGSLAVCHSFLTDGVWNFLSDCTHVMAGRHVAMEPLPDWVVGEHR